jgi:hypothetical protein
LQPLGPMFQHLLLRGQTTSQKCSNLAPSFFSLDSDLSITDPKIMCQLFDSLVRPILSYACEVWTGCTGAKGLQQAEQVHRMFLRGILGVNKTTSTFVVWKVSIGVFLVATNSQVLWYGSPHQIVCCIVPTKPRSRCSACSMITNNVGSGTCNCDLMIKVLGFFILISCVLQQVHMLLI